MQQVQGLLAGGAQGTLIVAHFVYFAYLLIQFEHSLEFGGKLGIYAGRSTFALHTALIGMLTIRSLIWALLWLHVQS